MDTSLQRVACDFRNLIRDKREEGFFEFFSDMSFLLESLDQISMVEGYNLYGCYKGPYSGLYNVSLYVSKPGEELRYTEEQLTNKIPLARSFWDIIFGRHPYRIERRMPILVSSFEEHDIRLHSNYLDYMEIPFTEMGVWQAFLLKEAHFFMPRVGGEITSFIYTEDDYLDLTDSFTNLELIRRLREYNGNPILLPDVEIMGDEAIISYCYWNVPGGLLHCVYKAYYRFGHIVIDNSPTVHDNLIPWYRGLRIN